MQYLEILYLFSLLILFILYNKSKKKVKNIDSRNFSMRIIVSNYNKTIMQ